MKIFLLIELNNEKITLAIAKKRLFSCPIYIINVSTTKIEPSAFQNGTIYNPSLIKSIIQHFLNQQKHTKINTIVSLPSITETPDLIKTLATFQAALCISKTGVKISRIIDKPIFNTQITNQGQEEKIVEQKIESRVWQTDNLLELLGSKQVHSPIKWVVLTTACIVAAFTAFKNMYHNQTVRLSSLNNQKINLEKSISQLTNDVKNFAQAKATNEQFKNALAKMEKLNKCLKNPTNHITAICQNMPKTMYLTHINFEKKRILEMEGVSPSIQAAHKLVQNMAKNPLYFNHIELLYIKKAKTRRGIAHKRKIPKNKKKNSQPMYLFKASGRLNYIC